MDSGFFKVYYKSNFVIIVWVDIYLWGGGGIIFMFFIG